jgi:phosphoglycerol transferase MdoB-like AlkP superfamily enzyme
MPCLLAILVVAFPRIAIILLWLFSNFFTGVYNSVLLPIAGFIFLPITLVAYTYLQKYPTESTTYFVILIVAVVLDLGLLGGGSRYRRRK